MRHAFTNHWPEYCMEAAELAIFMLAACVAAVVLFDPASAVAPASPLVQRLLMGLAMGGTAVAIIYSPLGKQSGAHFNPAVTLTYLRLGKIEPWDAGFYILFQFLGGVAGVLLAAALLGPSIEAPQVNYIVTVPGPWGVTVALLAEFAISFVLMSTVLFSSNSKRLAGWTPWLVGGLLVMFVLFEAPLSGMSMNPARTVASAWPADVWTAWWIYFASPALAMLTAAELYIRVRGFHKVHCAKLHHDARWRCIFRCGYRADAATSL